MGIEVKVEKVGDESILVIKIPLHEPVESSSGKTLLVAGTSGPLKTSATVEGKPITLNVNAYIPNPNKPKDKKEAA